jgi:DNA-directed RNA polymerase subunit RPC12/RpoP
MKESLLKRNEKGHAVAEHALEPQFITECPKCGGEVSLWSQDQETVCVFCDHKVFEREKTEH